ncbi:class I SAM-dependent methyltransferase, partial [Streptomyces xiamenensis]
MNRLTPSHPLPVDPVTWPDVAAVPAASRPRVAVTERLVRRAVSRLPLRVVTPDGPLPGPGGPRIEIHDPAAFHRRLGTGGTIGFGESYLAGEWDAPDLVAALTVVAGHAGALIPAPLQRLRGWWAPPQPASQHNAPDDARENIRRHYDLSNDLFALFLDPTLTYSSAVFRTLPARWDQLEQAQHRKIDRLLDLAGAGPGTRLLEIGTGWGELAVGGGPAGGRPRGATRGPPAPPRAAGPGGRGRGGGRPRAGRPPRAGRRAAGTGHWRRRSARSVPRRPPGAA